MVNSMLQDCLESQNLKIDIDITTKESSYKNTNE